MAGLGTKKFNFVSPGIFLNEIDKSQLPKASQGVGPLVIGRARRGPGMRPVRVSSYAEFVQIFGAPHPGFVQGDIWRDPDGTTGPTYAAYAAQAWLANNTPLTFMRLVGQQHSSPTDGSSGYGSAGWYTAQVNDGLSETTMSEHGQIGSADSGGAYGLWLIPSSSDDSPLTGGGIDSTPATGTLAAIWYVAEGSLRLSGTMRTEEGALGVTETTASNACLISSNAADAGFTMEVMSTSAAVIEKLSFNFGDSSSKHVRNVFNTNPTLTNGAVNSNTKTYWLGETFEKAVTDTVLNTSSSAGGVFGVLMGLDTAVTSGDWSRHRYEAQPAKTPWIFSQYLGNPSDFTVAQCQQLFRLVTHQAGQWDMHSLKIAIEDVKPATSNKNAYGTFTVTIRELSDNDSNPKIIERYSGVNLNPASLNYIGVRIGTQYTQFDTVQRRLRTYGKYRNRSQYIYVEMNELVDTAATNPIFLPFGFAAPPKPYNWALIGRPVFVATRTNWAKFKVYGANDSNSTALASSKHFQVGSGSMPWSNGRDSLDVISGSINFTGSFKWPSITCRSNSSDGGFLLPTKAYWGFYTGKTTSNTDMDPSVVDLLRPLPDAMNSETYVAGTSTQSSYYFTLDDISGSVNSDSPDPDLNSSLTWSSGSMLANTSISALSTGSSATPNLTPDGWRYLLQKMKIDKFIVPVAGGSDGLDIREREPFRNTLLNNDTIGNDSQKFYGYNTIDQALDIVASAEDYEYNLATMPGITNNNLTEKLISNCEERGDALAIIDLPSVYTPSTEDTTAAASRYGDVRTAAATLQDRQINSSYGCTYYPWVQIKDTASGATLYAPPSIAALGTMAYSEVVSEPWFAPAGFNRGGLTAGAAGIPVVGVTEKMTSKDRDRLYEANINPIASFPSEGIVVFGQKTLQVQQSALDRINVRRLMIFVKKAVSRYAARVLFDQNVEVTWNRFLSLVDPFLKSVQTRLGLSDYRVVLDRTTTTPELVDRNIMYAKIFLKPARAIEFIVVDFMITSTGASFDD